MLKADDLDRRILAFIESDGASEPFDSLAIDLFDHQFVANPLYHAYCLDILGQHGPASWRELPALWPVAWRLADVCSFDPATAIAEFRSSGTTQQAGITTERAGPSLAPETRSLHLFDTLDLYRAALAGPFAKAMLLVPSPPPGEGRGEGSASPGNAGQARPLNGVKTPILVLMPSPDETPDSSLSFMMGEVITRFGSSGESGFFVHNGQFLMDAFAEAITAAARTETPVVLASTAFGWVAFLDWLAGRTLPLPPGSRIMETGGYKGRTRAWPREELYAGLSRAFAVPADAIVSEYGMCELSSQFYSVGISASSGQAPVPRVPASPRPCVLFRGPAWVRVLAVDPESQQPVDPGRPGLLRVIDLANRGSTIVVQTEDVAIVRGEREFELIGRVETATPKGCSLTAEDLAGGRQVD